MKSSWELARDNIKCLKPCVHGGEVWEAEKMAKRPREEILDFSSSVNPLGSSQKALEAIKTSLEQITVYPDSTSAQLREAIAASFDGITSNNIVIGNGSTELIYLFADTFLENGEVALIPAPTFGEYENAVRKAGGKPRHIRSPRNFCVKPSLFTRDMKDAKIAFLCNPNNPTSILTPYDSLVEIVEAALEEDVLFFLDEDFLDFVDEEKQASLVGKINDYPNLFVLRSFTKVFGLTGLRVGYGIASEETTKLLTNAKIPWNVNCLAQVAALAALTDTEHLKKSREVIKSERTYLSQELMQIKSFKQYPADANFIFINIKESGFTAAQLKDKMLKQCILIRDCSSFMGLDDYHIRVAVKTRQENEKLLEALTKIVENST
ncbi:threonine-phosphate decarboxylase CobD [Candidatus Bathyarchaeota archaeon]|nr:threonine-phosphate decarboxylase CobD [Candidatus Bathyarchaeota archaeon]